MRKSLMMFLILCSGCCVTPEKKENRFQNLEWQLYPQTDGSGTLICTTEPNFKRLAEDIVSCK